MLRGIHYSDEMVRVFHVNNDSRSVPEQEDPRDLLSPSLIVPPLPAQGGPGL